MKKEIKEPLERLQWFKYVFGKINFAGKIATFEDQRKL
jgi:hypothetical protein